MNDQSKPSESSSSSLSAERTAAIRAHLASWDQYGVWVGKQVADELREVLAAYDQIAQELKYARISCGDEIIWRRKAEAALVVLTQRQQQIKALIDTWRERADEAWEKCSLSRDEIIQYRWCATELEKALGLLGSTASEDAPR